MLIRLQPFDIKLSYKPGKEMFIADMLSRDTAETKENTQSQ